MTDNPASRSVKIGDDERTGWSSERPRRDGAPARPVDISTRCRRSRRCSPGSSASGRSGPGSGSAASEPAKFADRVVEERGAVLALGRVRELLAGRVPAEDLDARAEELLTAAVTKRLEEGLSVVIPLNGFDADTRERYTRLAHRFRRPRHLVLLDAARHEIPDEERPALDELRRRLDAGEVGQEGFQTAMRLGGNARSELKRVVFAAPPRDD